MYCVLFFSSFKLSKTQLLKTLSIRNTIYQKHKLSKTQSIETLSIRNTVYQKNHLSEAQSSRTHAIRRKTGYPKYTVAEKLTSDLSNPSKLIILNLEFRCIYRILTEAFTTFDINSQQLVIK